MGQVFEVSVVHPSRLPHLVQLIGNAFESALLQPKELKNAISDNAHLQWREKKQNLKA